MAGEEIPFSRTLLKWGGDEKVKSHGDRALTLETMEGSQLQFIGKQIDVMGDPA